MTKPEYQHPEYVPVGPAGVELEPLRAECRRLRAECKRLRDELVIARHVADEALRGQRR